MGKRLIDPGRNGQEATWSSGSSSIRYYVVANISSQQALIRANLDQQRLSLADLPPACRTTGFRIAARGSAPATRQRHAARAPHSCRCRPGPAARGVRQDPLLAIRTARCWCRTAPCRNISSGPEPGQRRPAAAMCSFSESAMCRFPAGARRVGMRARPHEGGAATDDHRRIGTGRSCRNSSSAPGPNVLAIVLGVGAVSLFHLAGLSEYPGAADVLGDRELSPAPARRPSSIRLLCRCELR